MVTTECIDKPSPATAGERFLGFAEAALMRAIAFWRSVQNRRSVAKLGGDVVMPEPTRRL